MDSRWRKKEDEEEETRAKPSRRSSVGTKNVVGKASLRLMRSMAKALMERKPSSAARDQMSKVVVKEDDRCSVKGSERELRLPMEGGRSMMINMAAGRLSNVQEDEKRVVVVAELQRRSVSEVEVVNAESVAAAASLRVMAVDMPPFMQVHAFRCARRAYHGSEQSFSTRHIAFTIKKEFDKIYGPAWHCIVGSSFGSYVTHSTGCFIYFSLDQLFILLFKTKVQRLAG